MFSDGGESVQVQLTGARCQTRTPSSTAVSTRPKLCIEGRGDVISEREKMISAKQQSLASLAMKGRLFVHLEVATACVNALELWLSIFPEDG